MDVVRILITCLAFSLGNIANSSSLETQVVQVDEFIGNQPVVEYVNDWWQWAFSMPQELSPIKDITGEHCDVGQQGEVWFLAGGYGSSTIKRQCNIPAGKYIFFPVINMVYFPRYESSEYTCESAMNSAALNNDTMLDIYIELDGVPAWNPASSRMASPECFDVLGAVPREFNPPVLYPSATDGFWVMLKPLGKGKHTLKFQAKYNRESGDYGKMQQDIEYEITVH